MTTLDKYINNSLLTSGAQLGNRNKNTEAKHEEYHKKMQEYERHLKEPSSLINTHAFI